MYSNKFWSFKNVCVVIFNDLWIYGEHLGPVFPRHRGFRLGLGALSFQAYPVILLYLLLRQSAQSCCWHVQWTERSGRALHRIRWRPHLTSWGHSLRTSTKTVIAPLSCPPSLLGCIYDPYTKSTSVATKSTGGVITSVKIALATGLRISSGLSNLHVSKGLGWTLKFPVAYWFFQKGTCKLLCQLFGFCFYDRRTQVFISSHLYSILWFIEHVYLHECHVWISSYI